MRHYIKVEGADDPLNAIRCPECAVSQREGLKGAYISASEAVTVLRNAEGEVRIPGSADSPMVARYLADGYVKETINRHEDIRKLERDTGLRHERGSYDQNSAAADRYYQPSAPPKMTQPVAIMGRDGKLKVIRP